MIPLSSNTGVNKFPKWALAIIVFLFALDLLSRASPGTRDEFLHLISYSPRLDEKKWNFLSFTLFFPNIFSMLMHFFYFWAFAPLCLERFGAIKTLTAIIIGPTLAVFTFYKIHGDFISPIIAPEALHSSLLGLAMSREIWGSTQTLVLGFGWARIYDVPSYVLIFFYFFYLLLANFSLPSFLSDAPMLYLIPFISFITCFGWGLISQKRENNPKPSETL